ncbi:tRNA threonylcarbamoyladenosine biosynthesis protein TsaE [Amphibacillus marinus]|uniref:tRNA threonylcarbamoyladenosine biosynthesis protein TsaE n=1 Tax=Amphibacillus marinus TaxID=872970 RepID=A0A1H8KXT3_9BACI|nr:tRNA (adenosine(37)-N6)-threonylcarbamoyltransferase complex ATPase subunit type 1 TsaE [Amphibacillus marinus]SEN97722.1 tRNA threonylcarbamoyladenosine biosynthesis protein TsaE [Amphibacillus marinus]
MKEILTHTAKETQSVAQQLARKLRPNSTITLTGDLGAGKTTFTKGLGAGLGVKRTINSPTFTIVKTYSGNIPLYHIDAYRLEDSEEDIGFDDYFYGGGITVVEWPQFIEPFLPTERLDLTIERKGEDERLIRCQPRGVSFEKICEELGQ